MNPRSLPLLAAAILASFAAASGKPPAPAKPDARPAPTADAAPSSLLRWLLLQNGGPAAAAIPFPEIVRAINARQIVPLDPAAAPDAAVLAKLGATLDALLPHLNRPDGAPVLTNTESTARIVGELRAALDMKAEATTPEDALCPVLRWTDAAGGRTCHLFVAAYPPGGKAEVLRALSVRAADLASQVKADGPCLLIGLEYNNRAGRYPEWLNWELVDLAKVSLRCAVTFETDANGLHAPGATVADGRRGRD